MVTELKKFVDANKVFFGINQSLKNANKLNRVCLPSDVRDDTIDMLKSKKIKFDVVDLSKEEISERLELDFYCEVFGLKK